MVGLDFNPITNMPSIIYQSNDDPTTQEGYRLWYTWLTVNGWEKRSVIPGTYDYSYYSKDLAFTSEGCATIVYEGQVYSHSSCGGAINLPFMNLLLNKN